MPPRSPALRCPGATIVARCLLLLALGLFWVPASQAAQPPPDKQVVRRIQAGFLYNFIRFANWPATSLPKDAPLVIAILGDASSAEILRHELNDKKYETHPIVAKTVEADDPLEGVHMVFLLKKAPLTPAELSARLGKRPVLTIGEAENFTQSGGMIRLFLQNDTFHFSLNLRAAREAGINLSSQLDSMADRENP